MWPAFSETESERELVRPAAEIDLGPGEAIIEAAFGALISNLAPRRNRVAREAQAAERDGADVVAVGDVRLTEDTVVAEIDELSRFAVPPIEQAQADAEVRLHARSSAERQDADGRRQRDDAKTQILIDVGAVIVDEVGVDTRHGAAIEGESGAGLEIVADRDQPLGTHRCAVEIV